MQRLLGEELYNEICVVSEMSRVNEIRLRLNRAVAVKTCDEVIFLRHIADTFTLESIIKNATFNSRYAYEEEISDGYIYYSNGVRIGIVGDCAVGKNGIIAVKQIYSLCIRIPHEIIGCASGFSDILDNYNNTLIISPPGGGKTTLLREMTRLLSMRYDVLVIDEREEICGKNLVLRIGERCDVIQGLKKSLAFERAIRTMSPEIVVCDELFGEADFAAVKRMSGAGIKVLATYHSDTDIDGAINEIFCNRVLLSSKPRPGSIVSIMRGGREAR